MIEIVALSASLSIFINYIIGKPGSEFSPYEIFSSYTVWLSKRRLRKIKLLNQYQKDFNLNVIDKRRYQIVEMKNDFKRQLYHAAEPFFTWERAVGMCSICTGFWVSIATGLIFTQDFFTLLKIVVFSHILIRLLNKFL